ncbi:MAG: tetratricopeptide repeat protein [Calditrichaeota bacterium]|nr:tetratricopeptide repeat protein [Calditrichota bacterium]
MRLLLLIVLCTLSLSAKQESDESREMEKNRKAIEHYSKGNILANEGKVNEALNEYYEALIYNTTTPDIYEAIGEQLMILKKYEPAALNFKKALNLDPNNVKLLKSLADAQFRNRDFEDALSNFTQILKIKPTDAKTFELICFIYSNLKKNKEMSDFIDEYSAEIPFTDELAVKISSFFLKTENAEKARHWAGKALELNPDNKTAKIILSQLDISSGNTADALSRLKELQDENPKSLEVMLDLLQVLSRERKYDEMIKTIKESDISDVRINLYLAEAFFQTEEYEKAQALFAEIKVVDYPIYFELLAAHTELRLENFDAAYAYFNNIIKREPKIPEGYHGAAISLIQMNELKEAEKILKTGIKEAKNNSALYGLLTETLVKLNRSQEANENLERILRESGDDYNILVRLAQAYQSAKQFEKSDDLYERAIKLNGEDALTLNNYSYSLSVRGTRLDRALELIEKALTLEPENGYYLDTMGWIHYQKKNYDLAKKFILKAIEIRKESVSSEVLDHMGDIYFALNDKENARKYWEKALAKAKENLEIHQKIESLRTN